MPRLARLRSAAILAAIAAACTRPPVGVPSPDTLAAQVVIRRDTFGIPHILADTEEAAAFGFGYAQAEDHAVEIARRFVRARGEEARYFGDEGLENDLAMAQFENLDATRRGLQHVSPLYRQILAAYAAGVNRYVAKHRAQLPSWIPEFSAADVLANSRASAADALGGPGILRQLRQKYERPGSDEPATRAEWIDAPGSNALALGPSRTTTGKPILLGNPHLSWSSLYWEAHVRVPGAIDFYGSTLVGIPVLRAGFNDRLGFVTTNNAPDLDDVFALALDPERPDHYRFGGRSLPLGRRDVAVPVRSADGSLREERRTFWRSHVGEVIYRTPTHAFAVKSTRLDALRYFEGFYVLSKARTLADWQAALRLNYVPTSNFTYADADGNILYQWNARVPIRRPGQDYRLDVPAAGPADLWDALHPVDALPRLLNPPGGYIQNANNPPAFVSLRDPIDMTGFPAEFERGQLALRPQLALDLLERSDRFGVPDVIDLKYNTRMLLAERVRRAVVDAVRSSTGASAEARAGADALDAWDGRVAAASRGAVLFQRFWDGYAAAVRPPYAMPWSASEPAATPAGIADPTAAVEHLARAVRETREAHGSERVAWGDVHRFRAGDLDLPGDGASGTYGTFRVMRFDPLADPRSPDASLQAAPPARVAGNLGGERGMVGFGDAWVLLVDFSAPVTGWSVLAYGQTTDLRSPHSRDQLPIFAGHRLRRAWYTEAEIAANLGRQYRP
jgi:acyl-homoserine-lactone acylase